MFYQRKTCVGNQLKLKKKTEYSPLGKELRAQTDMAKKQYQKLDDSYEFEKMIKK